MDGFTYDPAQLLAASRELSNGSAAVEGELARLSGRVEPLRSAFQGKAADGFQVLWKEWHDSAEKLKQSLDGLSQLLKGAAENAAQMEDANARLMRG